MLRITATRDRSCQIMVLESLQQCIMSLRVRLTQLKLNFVMLPVKKYTNPPMAPYLILLVSYQGYHHVMLSVFSPALCNFIHRLLPLKPVLAERFSRVQGRAYLPQWYHLRRRLHCWCVADGKHSSEGTEACCKDSAALPICDPGEHKQETLKELQKSTTTRPGNKLFCK